MRFSGKIKICPSIYESYIHCNYATKQSSGQSQRLIIVDVVDATLSHICSVLYDAVEFILFQGRRDEVSSGVVRPLSR